MKQIIILFVSFFSGLLIVNAQIKDPVKWKYEAKKTGDNKYLISATATLEKPWHIYSQNTGEGPVPTKFTFNKNPLISIVGSTKESGKLEKVFDKNFNSTVASYQNTVVFSQVVQLKGKVKTNISGQVEYMVCNDEKCLPPVKKTFDIKLQ